MTCVWIVGAGYVGEQLARDLARAGHEAWALRRSTAVDCPGVSHAQVDVLDPSSLSRIPSTPTHVVFSLAAKMPGPGEADAYVDGLRNLLAELTRRQADVARVVLTSSTGVYGQSDGQWVDEASPTDTSSPRSERLVRAETQLAASPFSSVSVRFSGIYGPTRTSMIAKLRMGEARLPRTVRWTNRIHRDDCAGAVAHALWMPAPAPMYVATDEEPVPLGEVITWLAEKLGVPTPPLEDLPDETKPPYRGDGNKRCQGALLRASGYGFRYPTFREGYGALIDAGA